MLVTEDAVKEPTSPDVISIDDAAISELDPLSRVIDPKEVKVEGRLNDTEDDRYSIWLPVVRVELSPYPVEAVQSAIGSQGNEVK